MREDLDEQIEDVHECFHGLTEVFDAHDSSDDRVEQAVNDFKSSLEQIELSMNEVQRDVRSEDDERYTLSKQILDGAKEAITLAESLDDTALTDLYDIVDTLTRQTQVLIGLTR